MPPPGVNLDLTEDQPVFVTENGGRRKISKDQAIAMQLVNRAASGDLRATKILFDFERDIERQSEPASPETAELGEADKKVIEGLRARLARGQK